MIVDKKNYLNVLKVSFDKVKSSHDNGSRFWVEARCKKARSVEIRGKISITTRDFQQQTTSCSQHGCGPASRKRVH